MVVVSYLGDVFVDRVALLLKVFKFAVTALNKKELTDLQYPLN
jgi:hypothetical protein